MSCIPLVLHRSELMFTLLHGGWVGRATSASAAEACKLCDWPATSRDPSVTTPAIVSKRCERFVVLLRIVVDGVVFGLAPSVMSKPEARHDDEAGQCYRRSWRL